MNARLCLCLVLTGCSGNEQGTTGRGTPATALYAAYKENEVAAARRFEGKPIEVWGKVKKVESGVVNLVGDDFSVVRCQFDEKHNDRLSRLKSGQTISIRGQVTGYAIGDVHMVNCQFSD
jgi:starvation-inducible outer membrane lipoprotein